MLNKPYPYELTLLNNVYIYRKAISNDTAVAHVQKYIHTLFKQMADLCGPMIPTLVNKSLLGFSAATIIYFVCTILPIFDVFNSIRSDAFAFSLQKE